jgi:hypothetical protein
MIHRNSTMPQINRITIDLAGYCPPNPNYLQMRARINHLINHYMAIDRLSDRLTDLPRQFVRPQTRHWEPIDWKAINPSQIIGIAPTIFVQLLASATEIELPIRGYSEESWQYLATLHPQMADFMGGTRNPDGSHQTLGIWEKEERQHAPALSKIYQQLTSEKLCPKPSDVTGYEVFDDPLTATKQHVITRISTEWGATAVYLWLMAHSTGALQQAIAQPLQDEINHLAKFWGFSRWAFGATYSEQLQGSTRNLLALAKHHQGERTHGEELLNSSRSVDELSNAIELAFSLMRVMVRLRSWNQELSHSFLKHLFGEVPDCRN